ncbi:MAG TPA: protein kinase [Planctomycetota bacterium]|nr:protein kinase [Planctomycetota bacterium]
MVEALGELEDGGSAALEAFLTRHPEHASALGERIGELGRLGLIDSTAARAGARAERMGDFRLITELGGGGMGLVYEAEQVSLGRRVALKLIRPEQLWFSGSRARFRREIESVARLSHPGIVPIYTVGEEQSVPFFAMELIEGCTLAQVIARLSGRSPAKLTGADLIESIEACAGRKTKDGESSRSMGLTPTASWTEVSIHIVREVAEALEHAHSRGVVHRDIKPSNIVLTRTGRAMLIDFGLASKEGSERITRSGSAGGSAAYMSPEQTRGMEVDARTDIYSLGVTFAEMLTLRPLFHVKPLDALWQAIMAGDYERPRKRVPTIPWDVETVCTTAMETARERRYATAGDFARDLSNLLAHRPIDARRAGPMLRGLRWAQRHPRLSASLLATGVLGLCGALIYGRQQTVLGAEIRVQRDVARERAKELRELATGFVFDVNEKIKRLPGSTEAREHIVTQMQRLFDSLAKADTSDPTLAHDLAFADYALGTMLNKTAGGTLGQVTTAGEHLERAWTWFDSNARAPDTSLADRRLLVQVQKIFGNYLTGAARPGRGRAVLERGAKDARAVAADPGASLEDRVAVSWVDLELAATVARLGGAVEARELYSGAVTLLEAMDRELPDQVLVLRPMPRAYLLLADNLQQAGDVPRAASLLESGIQAGERLLALEPIPPVNRRHFADCLSGLGVARIRTAQAQEAIALLERALGEYEELRKGDPSELQCALDIARTHSFLSEALTALGDDEAAEKSARAALSELDSVPPSLRSRELSHRRLSSLYRLAEVETARGALDDARANFSAADEQAKAMLAEDASDLFVVSLDAQVLRDWADLEKEAGETARALELHRLCLPAYQRWLALAPDHILARTEESFERTLLANVLHASGDVEAALKEHALACEHALASMGPQFQDVVMLDRGVFTMLSAAEVQINESHATQAEPLIAQGIEWAQRVLAIEPRRELTRRYLITGFDMAAECARARGNETEDQRQQRLARDTRVAWAREPDANPIETIALAKEFLAGEGEANDAPLALELCRLAVERAPTQPAAHYWLAKALVAKGEPTAALESARAAADLIPKPVSAADEKLSQRVAELIEKLGSGQ